MRIEYLECFQAIEKYKSFSKAADSLYITQSALSKKIKALESILGEELFIRNGNTKVEISSFGRYISNRIQNLMEDYEILIAESENYRKRYPKKLRIGTFLNVAHSGLIAAITNFEKERDNFYVETLEKEHSKLKQAMNMDQIDICFGYSEFLGEIDGFEQIPIFQDKVLLITSDSFKKSRGWGECLRLESLRDISFCFPREDLELFTYFVGICRNAGFIPQLTNSDVRLGTIRQYISAGMRCTLQLESISRSKFYDKQFVFIELEDAPNLSMTMYKTKKRKKKSMDDFVDYLLNSEWCNHNVKTFG